MKLKGIIIYFVIFIFFRNYVQFLHQLFQNYIIPLSINQSNKKSILSLESIKILFPPSLENIRVTNETLLNNLENRLSNNFFYFL